MLQVVEEGVEVELNMQDSLGEVGYNHILLLPPARDLTYLIEPAMVVGLHFDQGAVGVVVPNFVAQQVGYLEVGVHDPDQGQEEGDDQTSQHVVRVAGDLQIGQKSIEIFIFHYIAHKTC
jgi:hypothetical protein